MLRDWSAHIHQCLAVHVLCLDGQFQSVDYFCSKILPLSFPRVSPAMVSKECKFIFKYWSRLLCLHLLEAQLRCSRQGNSSWTKPSLEWEPTTQRSKLHWMKHPQFAWGSRPGKGWLWSSSCLLVPMCPWEALAAKRFKSKVSLRQGDESSWWLQCPVTQFGAQHSPQTTLVVLSASHCHSIFPVFCAAGHELPQTWLKYWHLCHRCFHYQCPLQCGSCAASRLLLLPELGSWNGNKNPKPVDEEMFSAELRCQKSRFQLGCCVHWMSLTVRKMRRNYYFEISCWVMID